MGLSTLTTIKITNITASTAVSGGNIADDENNAVTARGVCWSTEQNPTIDDEKTIDGKGEGEFSSSLSDLTSDTKYYVRAYATNSVGTAYGNELSFTTEKQMGLSTLTTIKITNITASTAVSGGNIDDDENNAVTARGVCWSTEQNPTIDDEKTIDGKGEGEFSSSLSDLTSDAKYYVRAYATNSVGTAYGNEISFTTEKQMGLSTLTTIKITNITASTAVSGGNIADDENNAVTARGVCWSTEQNPTIEDSKTTDGKGKGEFSSSLSELNPDTKYYVRAYATNSVGTAYGNEISFTTEKGFALPVLSTTKVTYITDVTALSGGTITDDGNQAITSRGVCWSTEQNPTIEDIKTTDGKGKGEFSSNLTNLIPETEYFVRAYATNSVGTAYGEEVSFTTEKKVELPYLNPIAVTYITHYSAIGGGNIISAGGAEVTERGVCWSETNTNNTPTIEDNKAIDGKGTGYFNKAKMTNLKPNTSYSVRAFATNIGGTAYSNDVFYFETPDINFTDSRDGTVYKTITIGDQVWMAENLKYLPKVFRDYTGDETEPRYYVYEYQGTDVAAAKATANYETYGVLYNWEAAMTEEVCPVGWHIPADYEWNELIEFLGGEAVAGAKLKEQGIFTWKKPNASATNESGFTARPGGEHRWSKPNIFQYMHTAGVWWSSTEDSDGKRTSMFLWNTNNSASLQAHDQSHSYSIRCVRNTYDD